MEEMGNRREGMLEIGSGDWWDDGRDEQREKSDLDALPSFKRVQMVFDGEYAH